MRSNKRSAFTLVELLVVVGIIAILIGILLPSLNKARQSAQNVKCQANLRSLGQAMHMYASANKQYLPYTTTTLIDPDPNGQGFIWFNAVDPYLGSNRKGQETRGGVAQHRTYKTYKQCIVWELFEGDRTTGGQSPTKEFAKTYKMNSHLRRIPRLRTARFGGDPDAKGSYAKVTDVGKRSAEFVMITDGLSLDMTGMIESQWESGQFSTEVNDPTQATPALRHKGGANVLFVDGHVTHMVLRSFKKKLRNENIFVQTWESEFINAGGTPTDTSDRWRTMEEQGLRRNPNMPMIWSIPGKLHR